MVIWMHGLGDSGRSWCFLADEMEALLPWARWSFPDATMQPVSCHGGQQLRSWFDIQAIPVAAGAEHRGLDAAVSRIHGILRDAERQGFPASRVVLGGFSQGAALALHAGLAAPDPLAALCVFSGWSGAPLGPGVHAETPILMLHGTEDPVVPLESASQSASILQRMGCSGLDFREHSGLSHAVSPGEVQDLGHFLLAVLPERPPSPKPPPAPPPEPAPPAEKVVRHPTRWGELARQHLDRVVAERPDDERFARLHKKVYSEVGEVLSTPPHRMSVVQGVCLLEFDLESVEGVSLDVSAREVRLSGAGVSATVEWPAPVHAEDWQATFLKEKGQLLVRALPVSIWGPGTSPRPPL